MSHLDNPHAHKEHEDCDIAVASWAIVAATIIAIVVGLVFFGGLA